VLLSNARFGRIHGQTDPYASLLRDSEHTKDDVLNEHMPMKTAYETQLVQLEELIVQQRKQVQTLTNALDQTEQRYLLVNDEQSIE
jgi:flagellar biosynthesis chaperone FliJ